MVRVFFDLETGGLDPARHPVCQVGAVCEDDGAEFEVKARFAPRDADPAALAMGWYDEGSWRVQAVPLREALERFAAWVKARGHGRAHLAGHFAAEFDKPFLIGAYKREGLRFPADFRVLDTMQLALWLLPGRASYKLPDLYRDLCGGRELGKAGGALADARAARDLVAALRARFAQAGVPPEPVAGPALFIFEPDVPCEAAAVADGPGEAPA